MFLGAFSKKAQMSQIKSFQVRFTHGQTFNESIENINQLDSIIRTYGIEQIAKISFYYHTSDDNFHNLILRNEDNVFTVEFNRYVDNQGQYVEMTYEKKLDDYTEMLNVLKRGLTQESTAVLFIIDPFINN